MNWCLRLDQEKGSFSKQVLGSLDVTKRSDIMGGSLLRGSPSFIHLTDINSVILRDAP